MTKTKKVKDYMTRKVITFKPSDKIIDAAKVFVKTRISGAPVIDHGMVAGIVSVSDLTKTIDVHFDHKNIVHPSPEGLVISLLKTAVDYKKHRKKMKEIGAETVGQIMTRKVVSIDPEESIYDAAKKMRKCRINRLPVISKGKLVGIVAREDLIRALVD